MNYDDWKLASPEYSEEVSECCGAETFEKNVVVDDCDELLLHCSVCDEECETIDEQEYKHLQWESYQEDLADERRHDNE